jgi:cell division protease FtsH
MTAGFSGADLANAMNEAALMAAREKAPAVTLADFETAIERVIAGSEKKSRVMNPQERTTVAYHESGHALVAELVKGEPVAKISIVPHSRGALGYTMQTSTEDRYLLTAEELQDKIAVMLGGRAAELLTFHKISTGASDDIMRATELARRMVVEFGMSPQLGSVRYTGQQMQYMGQSVEGDGNLSPETRKLIDGEVQRIVTEQYERAQKLLTEHQPALNTLAVELLEHETVDGTAVKKALATQPQPKPDMEGAPLALVANG